jgi:hypothetical protein
VSRSTYSSDREPRASPSGGTRDRFDFLVPRQSSLSPTRKRKNERRSQKSNAALRSASSSRRLRFLRGLTRLPRRSHDSQASWRCAVPGEGIRKSNLQRQPFRLGPASSSSFACEFVSSACQILQGGPEADNRDDLTIYFRLPCLGDWGQRMCTGGWLDKFLCRLGEPAWAADVGLPLVVTLLGLGLAYIFLTHQIRHDVQLRRADRITPIVAELGLATLEAVQHMDDEDSDADYWLSTSWPEWSQIHDALNRAQTKMRETSAFRELLAVARDISWAWSACAQRRKHLEQTGFVPDRVSSSYAIDATLIELRRAAVDFAEALIQWEGFGEVPVVWPQHLLHVPLPRAKYPERNGRWMAYYAAVYEEQVRQYVAKYPERRTERLTLENTRRFSAGDSTS